GTAAAEREARCPASAGPGRRRPQTTAPEPPRREGSPQRPQASNHASGPPFPSVASRQAPSLAHAAFSLIGPPPPGGQPIVRPPAARPGRLVASLRGGNAGKLGGFLLAEARGRWFTGRRANVRFAASGPLYQGRPRLPGAARAAGRPARGETTC